MRLALCSCIVYDFLTNITLVISSGIIIYLFARALPRLPDAEPSATAEPSRFECFMRRIPLAKIDTALSNFFEKWLRKMRVMVLKTENMVSAGIKRMQSKTSVPPSGSLFEKKDGQSKTPQ